MSGDVLSAEAISVRRGRRVVLEPLDVRLAPGSVLGVYGPNGAGKSTLLQGLAGLLPLDSGRVRFAGRLLGGDLGFLEYRRRTAAVFQQPLLLRGSVRHNVALGLRLRGAAAGERERRVASWLERLKIAHLADRPVDSLSGGEAQRASLARALVLEPEILFLDEPFASLDAPSRFRLVDELAEILEEKRISTVFVTHDLAEAEDLCERCLVLDHGRLLQEGELSALIRRPRSRRVAEIVGSENIFEAVVAESAGDGVRLDWRGRSVTAAGARAEVGRRAVFVIRPGDVDLERAPRAAATDGFRGTVESVRRRRAGVFVRVRLAGDDVPRILCAPSEDLAPGEEVVVRLRPDAVWVLTE